MEQSRALEILKGGNNVFLTGPAGSGKTYILNQFIEWLHSEGKKVAITASTGIAATHIGGVTIHSWAGIGIKDKFTNQDLDDLMQKEYLHKRFKETNVLIIDEISMLHSYRLDMVDAILRMIRQDPRSFGGMQVVLTGDFFQLPPINRKNTPKQYFAFEARSWEEAHFAVCYLDRIYRQEDDPLLTILQEMRAGQVSEDSAEMLMERMQEEPPDYIVPTRLFTHNIDVDKLNLDELKKIDGVSHKYYMKTTGLKNYVATVRKYCMAPAELVLKEGAQVMFVKNNFSEGYVNGTLGTVIEFDGDMPIVETTEGKRIEVHQETWALEQGNEVMAEIAQLPLRLAWAITVHKSQGMTLDAAEMDLSKSFVAGMGYVALSRVKSLSGLYLRGANQTVLAVDPQVAAQDKLFQKESEALV